MNKARLAALLVCLLTLYAPVELTRVIIHWGASGRFLFEVVFMWVFYLAGMAVASFAIARRR